MNTDLLNKYTSDSLNQTLNKSSKLQSDRSDTYDFNVTIKLAPYDNPTGPGDYTLP
jgi:hypothetical protein